MAGMFLLLFAFAITPKLILHNCVADHKDGRADGYVQHAAGNQLSKASFNCPCDDLVSESPFVSDTYTACHLLPVNFSTYSVALGQQVHSVSIFCSSLRGPPAC